MTRPCRSCGALKDFLAALRKPGARRNSLHLHSTRPTIHTTEISKLTAYYGLYSRANVFHEVATRILFQEFTPRGASPVSIPGVGYDLIEENSPDPSQVIEIFIGDAGTTLPGVGTPTTVAGTETPPPAQTLEATPGQAGVGETIPLVTGFIRDHNGHAVPDGTIVHFLAQYPAEGGLTVPVPDAATAGGVARASFVPPHRGQIDIRAESEPAFTSITLQITILEEFTVVVTIQPTPLITDTPPPTDTQTAPHCHGDRADGNSPAARGAGGAARRADRLPVAPWEGLVVFAVLGLRLGQNLPAGRGRRLALFAALGALVGYNYFALGLPGAAALGKAMPIWSATLLTWAGGLFGLGVGWLRYGRTHASLVRLAPEHSCDQGDHEQDAGYSRQCAIYRVVERVPRLGRQRPKHQPSRRLLRPLVGGRMPSNNAARKVATSGGRSSGCIAIAQKMACSVCGETAGLISRTDLSESGRRKRCLASAGGSLVNR